MTGTGLLTARFFSEYVRRPINLALLVAVPLIFVTLAAGAISDFAEIIGGQTDPESLAAPTAGWAAAFLAGVAGFFHVLGSHGVDRRLAGVGMGARRVLVARLLSGAALAAIAAAASLAALAARAGIGDPVRAVAGTLMFALIYLGIGAAVGVVVRSEVNGSLVVVFVWMLDVFLGPAMAGGGVWVTRLFPSHFPTLVVMDASSGHAGPIGDLGWAVVWTVGALAFSALVFGHSTAHRADRLRIPAGWRRLLAGLRAGFRDHRRNTALWVLLVILPIFFITLSFSVTPDDPTPVELVEGGVAGTSIISMIDVHGAIMVPITVAFLAGLAGLFVVQGSLQADARLALAGFRTREILASRFGTITVAGLVTVVVSLLVTAVDFEPSNWLWFAVGNVIVALQYALLGVLVGALFGSLGGLYVMFLLPFIDVGIAQNIMFSASPPSWGAILPARGPVQVLVDGAFTPTFDQIGSMAWAVVWLIGLGLAAAWLFHRVSAPQRA